MESDFIFLLFFNYIYLYCLLNIYLSFYRILKILIAKKVTIMESLNLISIWKSQEFLALEILMSLVIGKIEVIDILILQGWLVMS